VIEECGVQSICLHLVTNTETSKALSKFLMSSWEVSWIAFLNQLKISKTDKYKHWPQGDTPVHQILMVLRRHHLKIIPF